MAKKTMTMTDFQDKINEMYGEGEWTVKQFTGSHLPVVLEHKCGTEKRLSRATSFTSGTRNKCVKCSKKGDYQGNGRPRLDFDEIAKQVSELTYDTYELLELVDATEMIVNHKSCDRPPFKTSTSRFISRGQRCACCKKGVVGRKPKDHVDYEE